jgi:integrase
VINPLIEIKRPKAGDGEPEVYTVESLRALLDASGPETQAFVAIGGLAGLRTAEMLKEREADEVIQWADVDFENARITIRPEVSKTTRRRYVPMCPALVKWLEPLKRSTGGVIPYSQSTFRDHMAALFTTVHVTPVDNGLRHSFASYSGNLPEETLPNPGYRWAL